MSAQLSTKLTLDGKEHNEGLRTAARELSKYKREVEATSRQLREFDRSSRTATGALTTFANSARRGNIDGMLISAGNAAKMFTKSFLGIAGVTAAAASLTSFLQNAVEEGTQLAMAGEGIRLAFERINKPGLLDNLREATHGTVTDLELMKQAVKFNDFNLNIEQMGTFLEFAQQKAKDTGQSVDYLVDSIVTGLGRQSLQIIDNLGISQAQVKARMKETGDMTTAVAQIIKERMAEAGDYVETAADRAARKETELKNAYEDLGRSFLPLKESTGDLFHTMEIGAINAMKALSKLISGFTQLGAVQNIQDNVNGGGFIGRITNNLQNTNNKDFVYSQQMMAINRAINRAQSNLNDAEKGGKGGIEIYRNRLQALINIKNEYERVAQSIMNSKPYTPTPSTTKTPKTKKTKKDDKYEAGTLGAKEKELEDVNKKLKHMVAGTAEYNEQLAKAKQLTEEIAKAKQLPPYADPKTAEQIKHNISLLQESLDDLVPDSSEWKETVAQIEQLQEKLEVKPAEGSMDAIHYQIAKIDKRLKEEPLDAATRLKLIDDKASLQRQMDEMQQGWTPTIKAAIQPIESQNKMLSYDNARSNANTIQQQYEIGIIGYDEAVSKLKEIDNILIQLGLEPLKIKVDDKELDKKIKKLHKASGAISDFGNAFSDLGRAAEIPALDAAGIVAEAIANVINGYSKASAQASELGPWAWIAFSIAGLAQVASVVSQLHSLSGYAEGGIVKGQTTVGDHVYARLNAGEMVLNDRQQSNLFKLLDGGAQSRQVAIVTDDIRIRGNDLYIALKALNGVMKHSGKNIGIQ